MPGIAKKTTRAAAAAAIGLLVLVSRAGPAVGDAILYPRPESAPKPDWVDVLTSRLAPLDPAADPGWPLVLWSGPDARRIDGPGLDALGARGIVPTIRVDADYLDAARRIQAAGLPVIYLEGKGGAWPYDLAGDFRAGRLDPVNFAGWRIASQRFRSELEAFAREGVRIDAAWLDYENAPINLSRHDVVFPGSRVPAAALADDRRFRHYRRQLWQTLTSTYFAAPLREVFPGIAVTNWVVSASRADFPLLDWTNRAHPRTDIGLFTATNPLAYGIDVAFHNNAPKYRLESQVQVDRIYTHILLRQVSADAHARRLDAPHLESMVWVSRWVRDMPERRTPVMSRAAYREALRHVWLRGADGMMVFNPVVDGYEKMAIREALDAASVYREMAPHAQRLKAGEVMNFSVPDAHRPAPFWSGVRTADGALVRTYNPGRDDIVLRIELRPGERVDVVAPPGGKTHRFPRR